jgi:hypothetical protein
VDDTPPNSSNLDKVSYISANFSLKFASTPVIVMRWVSSDESNSDRVDEPNSFAVNVKYTGPSGRRLTDPCAALFPRMGPTNVCVPPRMPTS